MNSSKNNITLKVFLSYLAIAVLTIVVGNTILSEIEKLSNIQNERSEDTNKIISIGKVLTLMYESESLGRVAIQSEDNETFDEYLSKNEELHTEIDRLQYSTPNNEHEKLLDSVNILVDQKVQNIKDLREIRKNDTAEASLQDAIKILANLENYMGRLSVENFVEEPEKLSSKERKVLEEYLELLNKNNPKEAPSERERAEMDSIIIASKNLIKQIHLKATSQKEALREKEEELLSNDLIVSQQLKSMLTQLESEILVNAEQVNKNRAEALARSRRVLIIASIIGVIMIIIFSLIILNDFWKTKRYREKLEEANEYSNSLLKSREQLVSMVSHDLRTPLNTIVGYTELLAKSITNPKKKYYIDHIKNASGFVTQLVDDLLDYTKLEAGKIQMEEVPFNLVAIAEETALSVQSIHTSKDIELCFNTDEETERNLVGDPYRTKQVLYNLIGNAFKFTTEGSITIDISLTEDQNFIAVAVTDTGIGIAKEKQELIFEEFRQAEDDTVKKFGGSGLGLNISQKLAGLMGGSLSVCSEPGKGSTFTLQLPAIFTDEEIEEEITENIHSEDLENITAVVIDDDETLLQLCQEFLTNAGIKVHPFDNGKKALEALPNLEYDVIITDIQLPEMNGFRFLDILQKQQINKPIIAVTGRKDMPKNYYTESGFSAILFKPYSPNAMLATLQNLFENTTLITVPETTEPASVKPCKTDKNYDLTSLSGFLGNDETALKGIIETYVKDTEENVKALNVYYHKKDLQGISDLSHRMLTMLKQLDIKKETEILLQLEKSKEISQEEIDSLIKDFNTAIQETLAQLKAYYESNP
ncbi:Signal transduction histidine kinase [Pustulibacterium marinum]|uniref:histidine kinase n=1 Tax=Pustulibacterium marinum TaxID=1224947 RepID=A0A1I7EWV1_9FLAO|nr:ATP-binding protein [Pustulibacterium marinum]SFU28365.1 Signal transduction histidine kinase [Pustulibacterium marinum]